MTAAAGAVSVQRQEWLLFFTMLELSRAAHISRHVWLGAITPKRLPAPSWHRDGLSFGPHPTDTVVEMQSLQPIGWLLALTWVLCPITATAANKPPQPGLLLGSHLSTANTNARQALSRKRSSVVPAISPKPGKIANSLNRRPGKIITINRKLPK